MRLNAQTDYAIRALMHLGVNADRLCTISEVASHFKISKNHLVKVVHLLGASEFIETTRGRGGGIRLALDPADIVIGDVVRATESDFSLVECFRDGGACRAERGCRLRTVLDEAMAAFFAVLDEYTLADLLERNTLLRSLLLVPAA